MHQCHVRLENGAHCARLAVWQDPGDRTWLCEEHAPPVEDRPRCAFCGQPGVWRRPDDGEWVCRAEHAQTAAV